MPLLDQELEKVIAFYQTQEKEALHELDELIVAVATKEEAGPYAVEQRYVDDDDDDDEEDDAGLANSGTMRRRYILYLKTIPEPVYFVRESFRFTQSPLNLEQ